MQLVRNRFNMNDRETVHSDIFLTVNIEMLHKFDNYQLSKCSRLLPICDYDFNFFLNFSSVSVSAQTFHMSVSCDRPFQRVSSFLRPLALYDIRDWPTFGNLNLVNNFSMGIARASLFHMGSSDYIFLYNQVFFTKNLQISLINGQLTLNFCLTLI